VVKDYLLAELPNTVHCCSWHGKVAAKLNSEWPGNIVSLSKMLTVLGDARDSTFTSVTPKGWSVDPKRSKSSFQEIHGYISVMATLKFTHIFKQRNNVLSKINVELL
jgi:hypothetical protein